MSTEHSFVSPLGPTISAYLALKRALGRRFAGEAAVLAHLDRYLAGRKRPEELLTAPTFLEWSLTLAHLKPTVRRNRMRMVRNLCLYQRRSDPECFVPDPTSFPARHQPDPPYIFTEQQIIRLLRAAAKLQRTSNSPLCPEVFRLAVVLLYSAGLRRGELVRLVLSDYDPVERTLLVRVSKFHKSRLVALSEDAVREMEIYLRARRRLPCHADAPLLVNRHAGLQSYSGSALGQRLHRLIGRAGIRTVAGKIPRVHDLRHTYAVHVLLHWYRAGIDVQAKLPALAMAMGHVSVASTAYYLAFIGPISVAASERFAQHFRSAVNPLGYQEGGR